jgi:N-methylhydantoinase A
MRAYNEGVLMSSQADLIRVGVDIGGTFTDLLAWLPDGSLRACKVPSTPENFAEGILNGLSILTTDISGSPGDYGNFIHGTTVDTNAILEEKGAQTALITTKGFRDVLELRRIRIPELYNVFLQTPRPMIPRRLRFEVEERCSAYGQIKTPLNMQQLEETLQVIKTNKMEAVAICLLNSYANPDHERAIKKVAKKLLPGNVFITTSEELVPEIREYERTSSVVINAYIGPIVKEYLTSLIDQLERDGYKGAFQIMMSNGGLMGVETAKQRPAAMVESGPAAGVIAAAFYGNAAALKNVITLDMGGTTAKTGLIEDGIVARTSEHEVGAGINVSGQLVKGRGHALKLPVIDLSEIGAGGGSIARVDSAGMLHVGPQSAGALPGPICYNKGGEEVTLADATAVLGYLSPEGLTGGKLPLNLDKARRLLQEKIAMPLGKTIEEAAYGIYQVAISAMIRAVKVVSTYRGRDPREFSLMAFGGNGPMVAARIAEELSMTSILVPYNAGVFSAFGLLVGKAEHEASRSLVRRSDKIQIEEVAQVLVELEEKVRQLLMAESYDLNDCVVRRLADLRYSGQAYELMVELDNGKVGQETIDQMVTRFHEEHERTYSHCSPSDPVDLINLRVKISITPDDVDLSRLRSGSVKTENNPPSSRKAFFGEHGYMDAAIITRGQLATQTFTGPAIIEDYDSTTIIPPNWSAKCDNQHNIIMEWIL